MEVLVLSKDSKSFKATLHSAFQKSFNEPLVHQALVAYMANGRQNTVGKKSRSEVRGGGAKPWKQKGTGRARVGSSRNPLWKGGGVTFASSSPDFSQKVNRKSYRHVVSSIFSNLIQEQRLVIVDNITISEPRTKSLKSYLNSLNVEKAIFIVNEPNENLELSARNLPGVSVNSIQSLDLPKVFNATKVVITLDTIMELGSNLI